MPFDWILGAITVWRLSSLLSFERGPGDIFLRIRKLAGIIHDDEGRPTEWPHKFLPEVISFIWCNSVWIAGCWVTAYYLLPVVTIFISLIFALSAGAILINKVIRG
jgi:hypothetical protein